MSEFGESFQSHPLGSQKASQTFVNDPLDPTVRFFNMRLEPLRVKCKECHIEAKCWFYASLISAIIATLSIICLVALTVYFVLSKDIASSQIIKIMLVSGQSVITGAVTTLIFVGKRYADRNEKFYLLKLDERLHMKSNEEVKDLINIIIDSHFDRQVQSELIQSIIKQLSLRDE